MLQLLISNRSIVNRRQFQILQLAKMTSEEVQSVAILDVHGKRMEWNGDDYVVQGSGAEALNKDDEERDSDQYLVNIIKTGTFPPLIAYP